MLDFEAIARFLLLMCSGAALFQAGDYALAAIRQGREQSDQ
jgi:hypothetical protein